jgi:hypothetical protein
VELPVRECPRRKAGREAVEHPPFEVRFGHEQEAVHLPRERCAGGILVCRRGTDGHEFRFADQGTIALVQGVTVAIGKTLAVDPLGYPAAHAGRLLLIAGVELREVARQWRQRRRRDVPEDRCRDAEPVWDRQCGPL